MSTNADTAASGDERIVVHMESNRESFAREDALLAEVELLLAAVEEIAALTAQDSPETPVQRIAAEAVRAVRG